MAGSITPLPIMQLEEEEDRQRYAALEPPKSIVVRYGYLKFIAELPYDGRDKPGCGSKLVVMTRRGIELGEMLTTTCGNSGCGKSVSRKQMLQYIENSGGKDFPFTNQGKVLRVATMEDMQEQQRLEDRKMPMIRFTKGLITELGLPMKLVDIEWLLGGERIIFHYTSESWVDFRDLVKRLAAEYQTRIEMHQVNARDEARLVADYEKCGQHCCCKQFLKVLKPVSMRSAKVQKATLDPTKISGRCGRLMCCLRYEDQTYEDLRKRLPHRQTRVVTVDGVGTVIDSQILTQLVLVALDNGQPSSAYPLENIEILTKDHPEFRRPDAPEAPSRDGRRDRAPRQGDGRPDGGQARQGDSAGRSSRGGRDRREEGVDRGPRRPSPGQPLEDHQVESKEGRAESDSSAQDGPTASPSSGYRNQRQQDGASSRPVSGQDVPDDPKTAADDSASTGPDPMEQGLSEQDSSDPKSADKGGRKRRRRRRRGGRGRGSQEGGDGGGANPSGPA